MKTIINRTTLSAVRLTLCAGMVLLAACTKEDAAPTYTDAQITPQAQFPTLGVEQEPSFKSRAAADPTLAMTLWFARADETGKGTNSYGAYGTTALSATRSAGAGVTALSFATPQYYISNNARSRFTGWWPAPTSFTGGVVSWTMDGSQDILTAPVREGNLATPLPTFAFAHRLSRLNFEVVASSAIEIASWGTISAVNILAQPTTCTYTPATDAATGSVVVSGSTTYAAKNFASGVLTTTAAARGDAMFIASSTTDVALSLSVVSSTRGTIPVTVAARRYEAGKAYKLTLSFNVTTLTATVVPWNDVTTDDNLGDLRIGDFKYGGIVYEVTDEKNYKVLSLDEVSSLKWSAKNTYEIGATGQSDADGKANVAAMKAYSANTAANSTTGTFATDFPAAGFCESKNIDGVTGWYLPAKEELVALYNVYTTNKTDIDAGLANNSGTAISSSGYFWSSTEASGFTTAAWSFFFSAGSTHTSDKSDTDFVRCVKSIAPRPAISLDLTTQASIPSAGDKYTVQVTSNYGWSVSSDVSGVTFIPASGVAGTNVSVEITVPNNTGAARNISALFTATDGSTTATTTWTGTQLADTPYIEINGVKWASGNLVADGSTGVKVGAAGDYGLYFQFGSLVGWNGGASGDGTGAGSTTATAINVKPSAYTGSTDYTACGYYSAGAAGTGLPATDDATTGIGDPCRYYLGSPWRTPTTAEHVALNNSGWVWVTSPANGMNFNTTGSTQLFLPASGSRNTDGSFYYVGTRGYYWSASVGNTSYGYYLYFNSGYVSPQFNDSRRGGFPVRCVQ